MHKFFTFILILSATTTNGQVILQTWINSGNSGTTCTDALGNSPEPQWSVSIANNTPVIYPRVGGCYTNTPNMQYANMYTCAENYPASIFVCFRAFEDDGGGCIELTSCLAVVCTSFATPAPGTTVNYTLSIPNNGSNPSWGTVNFSFSATGSFSNNSSTQIVNACDAYTWIDGNTYFSDTNSATHTLSNTTGCDSVVTLDLTLNSSSSASISVEECDSYTAPDNQIYTSTGVYSAVIPTATGCDSAITIDLTIHDIDTTISFIYPFLLTFESNATSYQWVECPGMLPIPGATSQSYNPPSNGSYAVIIVKNGCTDTSACFTLTDVGLDSPNLQNDILVYPNPSAKEVFIEFPGSIQDVYVEIFSTHGKMLYAAEHNVENVLSLSMPIQKGLYFIHLSFPDGNTSVFPVMRE